MRNLFMMLLILTCFAALFLICYAPALFLDRQFGFRDSAHYYYPLNQRVQEEWNQGRWPLWEPEENAGMPLLGNPTAAVLYPGKLVFAVLPYAWGARVYVVGHSALAFFAMLLLMRSWGTTWFGSSLSALAYAFGAPILFQYCNVIYLIGAAWLPLGVRAVDRWARLGRRWGLLELAIVLSMQTLGGDPQSSYLLGVSSIGYALGLAWHRSRRARVMPDGPQPRSSRVWMSAAPAVIAFVVWCAGTLVLAQWFPKLRAGGLPTPPLFWMVWVPWVVAAGWLLVALGFVVYWWKRGWRSPLRITWLGLAAAAALSCVLTAAQLLPVIEFTQRTSRAAEGGTHDIYPFSIEPLRLLEVAWPNILGTQFAGNNYWAEIIHIPGARPKAWVPSLYLGGLTAALAISSLTLRHGPPWRIWFSVVAVVGLLGSLGQYTSPIWMARVLAVETESVMLQRLIPDLGPVDPVDVTPIRQDRYLRDGDGSFYWSLTKLLPGFRQFRFPAKLFTFTTLGLAILAGVGWDRLSTGRSRGALTLFFIFFVLTSATLAGVVQERNTILSSFRSLNSQSMMGPFDPVGAYHVITRSLGQATVVFGSGLLLTLLARRRPYLAGSLALIVMTSDLAAANARFILTVPQAVFETRPEVLKIIEDAERTQPAPGPYRIHRMPIWNPMGWFTNPSKDRVYDFVKWEHDTIQPKYGINLGVEYTHTLGVAELLDYDWYFNGFPRTIYDEKVAKALGVELEKKVVYFPRRAYDMWNTRYLILPYWHGGWNDEQRGIASFMFETKRIYPDAAQFNGPNVAKDAEKKWVDTGDFRVLRNLQEFPRAWVVHNARMTLPITGVSRESRSGAFQEILHAGDMIWNDTTQRVYDPHHIAWVDNLDMVALGPLLSGERPRASETVKVTYPSPQQAVIEANLESPGLVVLADVYYPGWQLLIDDKPAPIYRVNGLMRGAAVPQGAHRLVYTYDPRSFRVGSLVSIGGLAALLILGLACARWPVDLMLTG